MNAAITFRTIATVALALFASSTVAVTAQDLPEPGVVDIPCATNIRAQVLGRTPLEDGANDLILARIIFDVDGSIGLHTHPGTLIATVETGELGFTLIDEGEMVVSRVATADREAVEEPLVPGEQVTLQPGDHFVEMGMVHTAENLAGEPTAVLISGMIATGEPLTICVDDATPAS